MLAKTPSVFLSCSAACFNARPLPLLHPPPMYHKSGKGQGSTRLSKFPENMMCYVIIHPSFSHSLPHVCQRGFFLLLPSVHERTSVDSCPAQTVQLFRKSSDSYWRRNNSYRHQLLLKIKGRIQLSSTAPWLASHSMCLESQSSSIKHLTQGGTLPSQKDGLVLFVHWPTSFQDKREWNHKLCLLLADSSQTAKYTNLKPAIL